MLEADNRLEILRIVLLNLVRAEGAETAQFSAQIWVRRCRNQHFHCRAGFFSCRGCQNCHKWCRNGPFEVSAQIDINADPAGLAKYTGDLGIGTSGIC